MNAIRKYAAYIVIGLLVIFVGGFLFTSVFKKNEGTSVPVTSSENNVSNEPPFTHEGQLWFLSDKGDTITQIAIEVADNEYETTRGLMFRKTMDMQQGMLFEFADEDFRSFWMKNTYLPLDIIYAAANGEIGSCQLSAVPYSEESLPSKKPAKYVVEVNAGFWVKYQLKEGYKVVFERM